MFHFQLAYMDIQAKKLTVLATCKTEHENCHFVNLILFVNENNFPALIQNPFTCPGVKSLPDLLSSKADLDIPVVLFFDNSSVICVREENGYKFLDSWNGNRFC